MPDPWSHPQGRSKCPSLAKLCFLLDLSALLLHMLQQTKCLCSPKAILPQAILPVDISSFVWIKGCHHSFMLRIWFSPFSSHSRSVFINTCFYSILYVYSNGWHQWAKFCPNMNVLHSCCSCWRNCREPKLEESMICSQCHSDVCLFGVF